MSKSETETIDDAVRVKKYGQVQMSLADEVLAFFAQVAKEEGAERVWRDSRHDAQKAAMIDMGLVPILDAAPRHVRDPPEEEKKQADQVFVPPK